MTEPREAIICEECGRALAGIVELVDHYLLRHEQNVCSSATMGGPGVALTTLAPIRTC
jgi:hypothetical protein